MVLSKSQCTIPALRNNGITATTGRDKSNMLNNYFASYWNNSLPPLIEQTSDTTSNANNESLFCSTEEVQALLSNLDVTKATGPDGISARMLKAVASTMLHLWQVYLIYDLKRTFPTVMETCYIGWFLFQNRLLLPRTPHHHSDPSPFFRCPAKFSKKLSTISSPPMPCDLM